MFHGWKRISRVAAAMVFLSPLVAQAASISIPERLSPRPETTTGVPHKQINITPKKELSDGLLRAVAEFPDVTLTETVISIRGAVGFTLDRGVALKRPQAIVGGREFAHLHPDGSLHASLAPDIALEAIDKGWAIFHPWSKSREGWEGFVMLYTPANADELDTVIRLVESSYEYVAGYPVKR